MERLNFNELTAQVAELGTNAQATLMYRLVQVLGPAVLRSTVRYSFQRLDKINSELPEGHPRKIYAVGIDPYRTDADNPSSFTVYKTGHQLLATYKSRPNDWKDQTHQQPGDELL